MKQLNIGNSGIMASEIALGCMRISGMDARAAAKLIDTAVDNGINFFDHADIYGGGQAESTFAQGLKFASCKREDLILQTKCAIRGGYYDFSKEHIIHSVENSLSRLETDYLDLLLLHRPDTLVEAEDIAEAFSYLHNSGKVRQFGVSNFTPLQIELLEKFSGYRMLVNQLQFSITNTSMIDAGLNANTAFPAAIDRDGGVLDYCRLRDITIQAWSPMQHGFFEGLFIDNDQFPELNQVLDRIAAEKGVSKSALSIAWILRHPAKIQPIVGSTNLARLADFCTASNVSLSREEWYEIYRSAGNRIL
ncbi:MAG TPA: aldo/keto reductase [Firmicutes bacterium]|nr:aldo/keto reductase [Bacillota bacterium]